MQPDPQPEPVADAERRPGSGSGRRCILVIEDDPAVRDLVTMLAQDQGYDVLHTGDGLIALQLALSAQPGLIILDLGLPDVDGQSLLERLKEDPATAHIPVIVTSGLTHLLTPEDRALTAAIFRKPFGADELAQAIERVLAAAPAETPARRPSRSRHLLARIFDASPFSGNPRE